MISFLTLGCTHEAALNGVFDKKETSKDIAFGYVHVYCIVLDQEQEKDRA